jgi:hypothetical protein
VDISIRRHTAVQVSIYCKVDANVTVLVALDYDRFTIGLAVLAAH